MLNHLKELSGYAEHLFLNCRRIVFNVPADLYFNKLSERSTRIRRVLNDNQEPINCKTCGFARARLTFDNGWELEECTAIGFRGTVDYDKLEEWVAQMPRTRVTSDIR